MTTTRDAARSVIRRTLSTTQSTGQYRADAILDALREAGIHMVQWRPIDEARKDNTLYALAVKGGDMAFENLPPDHLCQTIGFNAADDTGEDRWRTAGWCWEHDHIVEGDGEPTHFLADLPPAPQEPSP